MRKTILLPALILVLIVVLGATAFACGGTSASSTTLGATSTSSTETTAAGETTSTAAGETTTTVAGETTTSTSEAATTTTEAAQTSDTADHAADIRAQYPSTESFDNSTWATLNAAPASHLGAAVDVKGQPAGVTVDPDSRYLTWQLTVTGSAGEQMKALCRTNIPIDRALLSSGAMVEVKGLVVGAQASDAGGGAIIYVESVQKAV